MDCYTLVLLASVTMLVAGWSFPFYPVHRVPQITQIRVTRFAPLTRPRRFPIRPESYVRQKAKPIPEQPKHNHDYNEDDEDHDHKNDQKHNDDHKESGGVIGPVHTFVKTDKNANYKWGVRHHIGNKRTS